MPAEHANSVHNVHFEVIRKSTNRAYCWLWASLSQPKLHLIAVDTWWRGCFSLLVSYWPWTSLEMLPSDHVSRIATAEETVDKQFVMLSSIQGRRCMPSILRRSVWSLLISLGEMTKPGFLTDHGESRKYTTLCALTFVSDVSPNLMDKRSQ